MIRHVVFFKFRPEATASQRKEVIADLRALPDKIDAIRTFELGEDIMRSARAWDFVLIATYDDLGALDVYTRHDDHVAVAMKIKDVCEAVGSVDYEY